jgi:hypothetical protein
MADLTVDFRSQHTSAWFDQQVNRILDELAQTGASLVDPHVPRASGFLAESLRSLPVGSSGQPGYTSQRTTRSGRVVQRRANPAEAPGAGESRVGLQADYAGVREDLGPFLRTGLDELDLDDVVQAVSRFRAR